MDDYHPSFRLDATRAGAGGAIYWTSAGGLGFANLITLTDDLGDRRLDFLINFYGSFENSDLAGTYTYLKRRIDLSVGTFLYNNFYNSMITTVGELLTNDTFFKEKNYGFFGPRQLPPLHVRSRGPRPADPQQRSHRLRFRRQWIPDPRGQAPQSPPATTLGIIHDNALFGMHGPMAGSRWSLSVAKGLP